MDDELAFAVPFLGILVLLFLRLDVTVIILWIFVWLALQLKFAEK